jgi:hypothetical protein
VTELIVRELRLRSFATAAREAPSASLTDVAETVGEIAEHATGGEVQGLVTRNSRRRAAPGDRAL